MTPDEIMEKLPELPEGSEFKPVKVDTLWDPHPFCIGPEHVAYASDHCCGMLSPEAIAASGVGCQMEKCNMNYNDHISMLTLFVEVPDNKADLNELEGLGQWLCDVKELNLGLDGFAFLNKE